VPVGGVRGATSGFHAFPTESEISGPLRHLPPTGRPGKAGNSSVPPTYATMGLQQRKEAGMSFSVRRTQRTILDVLRQDTREGGPGASTSATR
jgi:hypothetical protein